MPYLPPVSWYALFWRSQTVVLEANEHFQKGSYRNRCHIAGPNGVQRLSIPLQKGKHQQTPIRDVRIAYDEAWQVLHWRSILTAYGSAPYFEHYINEFAPFFEKKYTFLFDFNLELLQLLIQKTGWSGTLRLSDVFAPQNITLPDDFRDSMSPKIRPPAWFSPARYPQVFAERHGFLPDLSALDLLFCCGKRAGEVLSDSLIQKANENPPPIW